MNPTEADVFGELWSALVILLNKTWPTSTFAFTDRINAIEVTIKLTPGKEELK